MDAQIDAFGQAQAAAIEQQAYEAVWRLELIENRLGFRMRKDNGNVSVSFGANDTIELAKFAPEHVAVKEEERVKSLILGGGGNSMTDGQLRKKAPNFGGADVCGGPAAD